MTLLKLLILLGCALLMVVVLGFGKDDDWDD